MARKSQGKPRYQHYLLMNFVSVYRLTDAHLYVNLPISPQRKKEKRFYRIYSCISRISKTKLYIYIYIYNFVTVKFEFNVTKQVLVSKINSIIDFGTIKKGRLIDEIEYIMFDFFLFFCWTLNIFQHQLIGFHFE